MKISDRNSKLGKIPNISLIPVADCGNCSVCKAECYALKAWRQYPATRASWRENSAEWRADIDGAAASVLDWFSRQKSAPRFFRIHVAGDFLNQQHVDAWARIAKETPATKFLAFSKMYQLDYRGAPDNLCVVLSMWPGLPGPRGRNAKLPRAYMQDGTEKRVPVDAIACPGNCENCGMCWNLADLGRDVVFEAH